MDEINTSQNEYMFQFHEAVQQQQGSGQTGVQVHRPRDQQRGGVQGYINNPRYHNAIESGANQQEGERSREVSATAEEPVGTPNDPMHTAAQSPGSEDYEIMTPPFSSSPLPGEQINRAQQPPLSLQPVVPVYLTLQPAVTTSQSNHLLQSTASSVEPVVAHSSRTQPVLTEVASKLVSQTGQTTSNFASANIQSVVSPQVNSNQTLSVQPHQPMDYLYPLQSYSVCGPPVVVSETPVAAVHQAPVASRPSGQAAPVTAVIAQPGIQQPPNQIQALSHPRNEQMTTVQPHVGTSHSAAVVRLPEASGQQSNGGVTSQEISIVSHT